MGKPTGFMDYKRAELALRAPEERIKDWQEIKTSSLPHKEALRCQAARCMDCGVPFCHSGVMINRMVSGCPLHNLMLEFNDLVYHGMDDYAYARLNKTNNFPGFTSHVCPAPCEGACTAVLLAMGFVGSEERLFEEFKLAKAPNGSIAADDSSYATSVPGVFAAGDARRGQSLVVWAIAEGRGAAHAVDKFLQK